VVETQIVVLCHDCGTFWSPPAEPASCDDLTHEHQRFASHLHRSRVVMPDGTAVTGVSFGSDDPYAREASPDFGLYLDDRWRPPWPHEVLDWPDFGVPEDPAPVAAVLQSVLDRARAGERVEIGCYGGHGRTGTALACLAVLCGLPPARAVTWVRATYSEDAVETDEQAAFAHNFSR
jgi:hypothetical protein